MDSIVASALSEICSQGVNGISLTELWPTLHNSLSTSGLNLCDGVKKAIWNRILSIPGLQFESNSKKSCFHSHDLLIQSFDEAEKLGLKIIAPEKLRDNFVGMYDLKSGDAGISLLQRRALERLARARSDGVTQNQLAKEFGMKGTNIFYVVRNLECQGLVVRQSTTVRTKEAVPGGEDCSKNTSIVHTNLIHLYRYAKHLNSQQKLEITKTDTLDFTSTNGNSSSAECAAGINAKDDVVVKDYLPSLKAVCDKLEEADGKVLVVSDIKQALGYRRNAGHRAWRNVCNRLKDAHLVEEFQAEVNRKVVTCLRLLKKFDQKLFQSKSVICGSDELDTDQTVRCGSRGQISEQVLELPIEHQIYDMIAAEGAKGLTVAEICKRLGINNKKNYTRLLNMFSRFGCHLEAESHNRSMLYRVWTSGNFSGNSSTVPPGKSADVDELSTEREMELVLPDKSDAAMLQLDTSSSKEESATPDEKEHEPTGLELSLIPSADDESKQMLMYERNPLDVDDQTGYASADAEHEVVQIESHIVSSETPSPPSSRVRSYPRYPCLTLTAATAQREQRILERLEKEKFVLVGELYRWLEGLEKEKPTTTAKKTLIRTLNKLQNEGHCKVKTIHVPVVTNCGRSRTTEVVLHKTIQPTPPHFLGQIHERVRYFDMQSRGKGLSRLKNEKPIPVLTDIKRIFSDVGSDSQAVRSEAMRANGFVIAKMVRAKLLHNFLWGYLTTSLDWDDVLLSGKHGHDLKNPHSTCKLFAVNEAIKAMPLELFLQVVGSTHKFQDLLESCKRGLRLSDLPVQDYKSLMNTQATGRLSWIFDILRRLKLIRLVTNGQGDDADIPENAALTHAMELKPYIEEPLSSVPLFPVKSLDLRPRIRHDFILSNKEAVDIYWKTLEYCYAAADPAAAVHAFPGSAAHEVFLYRSWTSVRVMTADQRSELLKRVVKNNPNAKISFADCVRIAKDLNLTLQQVLRVSYDKRQSRLHRFQRDINYEEEEFQPGISNCKSASRKRKKPLKVRSSKHRKCMEGESGKEKLSSVSENNDNNKQDNAVPTHTGENEIHLREFEDETHTQNAEKLGQNGEDGEKYDDFINQFAFSNVRSRQPKFDWTAALDRELVIQYVKYRAALGARYYRTIWVNLPDLPAPPDTCRRRMSYLRSNQTVRRSIMRLCKLLSEQYVKHLQRSNRKELLNHSSSGRIVQESEESVDRNFPNCLQRNLESDLMDQSWDDFEDQNIRGTLDEVLQCIRLAKLEGYKRTGASPEKEWADRNFDTQSCDFQEPTCSFSNSGNGEKMGNLVGKRKRRTSCHRLPGKFLKFLNEGMNVSRRVYESLAVANAVELLKLVFLNTSTASEVPTLLAEILRRYSQHDLFAAFNYLREKKYMVGGNGSQPFVLSQKFLHVVSSSPFPVNTGKRASKFASWLFERQKDLMEEGISLNADLQCGDIFHLLAVVSSGEFFISPCLPDEGSGEAEQKRSSKCKSYEDEGFGSDQVKKSASSLMNDNGECVSRREKGFPGIKVSLSRINFSGADALEFFKNEEMNTNISRFDENEQSINDALGITNSLSCSSTNSSSAPKPVTANECPWKAMTTYGELFISSLSKKERVGPLYPELFQTVYSNIRKSGDQGMSITEVSQTSAIEGEKMAEFVVDMLQLFGLVVKVNAFDQVHVVDSSFRSKYFLSSADSRYQNLKSPAHLNSPKVTGDNYVKFPQEHVKETEISRNLDVHKVTVLNLPEEVSQLSDRTEPEEENLHSECHIQMKEPVPSEGIKGCENWNPNDSRSGSFRPILPWINGDGTTNPIVYKGITRRVLGIVMQNPGILENGIIQKMDTLNPQNCRKLLELMVLDNHLKVRKMYQITSKEPPTALQSLFGSSFKKPKPIFREHYFANPMSTTLL